MWSNVTAYFILFATITSQLCCKIIHVSFTMCVFVLLCIYIKYKVAYGGDLWPKKLCQAEDCNPRKGKKKVSHNGFTATI